MFSHEMPACAASLVPSADELGRRHHDLRLHLALAHDPGRAGHGVHLDVLQRRRVDLDAHQVVEQPVVVPRKRRGRVQLRRQVVHGADEVAGLQHHGLAAADPFVGAGQLLVEKCSGASWPALLTLCAAAPEVVRAAAGRVPRAGTRSGPPDPSRRASRGSPRGSTSSRPAALAAVNRCSRSRRCSTAARSMRASMPVTAEVTSGSDHWQG